MMSCPQCNKPTKDRLVTDEFISSTYQVTVTGIRSGVCPHCGRQFVDADVLEEIEMFVRPLLAGGIGMRLLDTSHLTIDLGHSLHPSAIDIAGPSFQHQSFMRQRLQGASPATTLSTVQLAEEAA